MNVIIFSFILLKLINRSEAILNNATHRQFPENFLFGVATSAYQIEGAWNVSDKGENIWDHLTHFTDLITDGSNGDITCDSYHQYKRDIEMLKELGVSFYRFSISWSRILPTGFDNKISFDGVAYYQTLIDLLESNNISAAVTLYHWDLPQPLQDLGGWTNPLMEKYFADYARVCFTLFGDKVKTWVTINEPFEVCEFGYGDKDNAPALGFHGIANYLCGHTVLKAHASAYHLYDEKFRTQQKGKITFTLSGRWYEPEDPLNPLDVEASETALQFTIGWFSNPVYSEKGDYPEVMKRQISKRSEEQGYSTSRLPVFTQEEIDYIKGTYDFFGLNHYSTSMVTITDSLDFLSPSFLEDRGVKEFYKEEWPASPASSWLKVVPWGFKKLLTWVKKTYDNPEVFIFENGYSDLGETADKDRIDYHHQYQNALLDAVDDGSRVIGYTVWTLMDNFEWIDGYKEKFGLFEVDFISPNKTRTAKASAKYYTDIISTKTIERIQ